MKGLSPISDWVEVRLLPREFPGSLNAWVLSSETGDTEEGVTGNRYIPVPYMMLPVVEEEQEEEKTLPRLIGLLDALWKDSRRVVEMDRIGRID